ncbi:MAG: glucose-6-phosphate isomerase [Rhodothermales bacterium]
MLRFEFDRIQSFLGTDNLSTIRPEVISAHRMLLDRSGSGSDFLGWRDLLTNPNDALLQNISTTAEEIRSEADVLLCIGIGGSYLGARAVLQALTPYLPRREAGASPEVLFAGHHMSGAYVRELLDYLEGKSVYVNVISKSGTTLEPALAFRFIYRWMEDRFDDLKRRIIVTTDPTEGALNVLHRERGYRKYIIPPDVGGRFSVLTPVGLLPIAAAGIDILSLFYGAASTCERYERTDENSALDYAAARCALLRKGYSTELLALFEPRLLGMGQWWQQLFGESEGKEGNGLFPAVVQYSTDLHSIGQYVQDGKRTLIETFLMVENDGGAIAVPESKDDLDGLNYLTGKPMTSINKAAYEGTSVAHTDGGVPNMTLWMDRITPGDIGEAIYFFEHAVAVGGYLLGINPFDQPGVEAYKREMFRRLGRRG